MSNKKNLLIYAHYYIPDTASTGQILRELAEGMLDKFNITVICVVPSYLGTIEDKYKTQKYYEEEINGVKVLRIRVPEFSKTNKKSRVKNIVSYFFGAMGATFKVGKMDYVFSISQPPILGGECEIIWTTRKILISCGFTRLDLFTSTCFCLSWCVTASVISGANGFWLRSILNPPQRKLIEQKTE